MAKNSEAGYVRCFETLGSTDVALVGGKNASLGETIQEAP
jgi:phosphoenolpyruvate synthase/pyruvate phosphate dikinase